MLKLMCFPRFFLLYIGQEQETDEREHILVPKIKGCLLHLFDYFSVFYVLHCEEFNLCTG